MNRYKPKKNFIFLNKRAIFHRSPITDEAIVVSIKFLARSGIAFPTVTHSQH